tara:strand:- start:2407 stop:3516 length:1110 start_codon:yes stop_codon:yes gene_type:complete
MKNLNYLKKLVMETIEEDVRGSTRKKAKLSESKNKRSQSHKRKLVEGLKKALETINEKADPNKVDTDRFPMKLTDAGKYDSATVDALAKGGADDGATDDDTVGSSPANESVKDLLPSQTSMNTEKAVCFALAALDKQKPFLTGPGGDLEAVISSDNHIMDGHHRWVASGMVDTSAQVQGVRVEFPALPLLNALNLITVELTGRKEGKGGSGDFSKFNKEGFLAILKDFLSGGAYFMKGSTRKDWDKLPIEKIQKLCEEYSGLEGEAAIDKTAEMWGTNMSELTTTVPSQFPKRIDMPVLEAEKGHVADAVEMLRNGEVDLNPPHNSSILGSKSDPSSENPAEEESSPVDPDKVEESLKRWGRLAGLLKG